MRLCGAVHRRIRRTGVHRRHFRRGLRRRAGLTEFAEPDAAVVGGQEVHEAAIVAGRHAEQRQQRLVAAARLAQAAPHELAQVVARDVARQEQRIDVLPERRALLDERVVQLVGDLAAAIGDRRQQRRVRCASRRAGARPRRRRPPTARPAARRRSGARGRCRATGIVSSARSASSVKLQIALGDARGNAASAPERPRPARAAAARGGG